MDTLGRNAHTRTLTGGVHRPGQLYPEGDVSFSCDMLTDDLRCRMTLLSLPVSLARPDPDSLCQMKGCCFFFFLSGGESILILIILLRYWQICLFSIQCKLVDVVYQHVVIH